MKKYLSLLALLASASFVTVPAQAANTYVSAMGGISWMGTTRFAEEPWSVKVDEAPAGSDVELHSGANFLGAVGRKSGHIRVEAEAGYQKHNLMSVLRFFGPAYTPDTPAFVVKGSLSVTSLLANAYYDCDLGKKIQLYATAGVGPAWISLRDVAKPGYKGYNMNVSVFAWQAGAGLTVPVSNKVKVDLRYRYFATSDFSGDYGENYFANYASTAHVSTDSVLLGVSVDL